MVTIPSGLRWQAVCLALALGVALPVLAFAGFDAGTDVALRWRLEPVATPAGDWSGAWSAGARTIGELAIAALGRSMRLLVGLAIVTWLSALAGLLLGLLREAAASRREWALRSAMGATPRRLRGELAARGLRMAGGVALGGLLLAAAGLELLGGTLPGGVVATVPIGARSLATPIVAAAVLATVGALTAIPLLTLPGSAALRRPVSAAALTLRGDVIWLLAVAQLAGCIGIAACAALLAGGAPALPEGDVRYAHALDTVVLRTRLAEDVPAGWSWDRLRAELEAIDGVAAATVTTPGAVLGLGVHDDIGANCPFCTGGGLFVPVVPARARHLAVDDGFFGVLGFDAEAPDAGNVVVDAALADRLFRGGDPLGLTVTIRGETPLLGTRHRITGVVAAPRPLGLASAGSDGSTGALYFPLDLARPREVDVVVRGGSRIGDDTSVDALVAELAALVDAVVPSSELRVVGRLDRLLEEQVQPLRWLARNVTVLAAAALLFAFLGVAIAMLERARLRYFEIGLRRAVGATRLDVVRLVLSDAMRLTAVACFVGFAFAAAADRGFPAMFGSVEPLGTDSRALLVAAFAAAAILVSLGSARHATRIEPVEALRG